MMVSCVKPQQQQQKLLIKNNLLEMIEKEINHRERALYLVYEISSHTSGYHQHCTMNSSSFIFRALLRAFVRITIPIYH